METRKEELFELQSYIQKIDKELTMVLQRLQWDQNHLLQGNDMVTCLYNSDHLIPKQKKKIHEKECMLRSEGYTKEDVFLPEPVDTSSKTCVRLDKNDIKLIIEKASNMDPMFIKGVGCDGLPPMTYERLISTYTTDERRVIYDAVVATAPTSFENVDFTLPSGSNETSNQKSRLEILAEQRDMKRRRAKYKVATKSKNYSQVLSEVIKSQMELYAEIQAEAATGLKTEEIKSKPEQVSFASNATAVEEHHEISGESSFTDNRTYKEKYVEDLQKRIKVEPESSKTYKDEDYASDVYDKRKGYHKDDYNTRYDNNYDDRKEILRKYGDRYETIDKRGDDTRGKNYSRDKYDRYIDRYKRSDIYTNRDDKLKTRDDKHRKYDNERNDYRYESNIEVERRDKKSRRDDKCRTRDAGEERRKRYNDYDDRSDKRQKYDSKQKDRDRYYNDEINYRDATTSRYDSSRKSDKYERYYP